MSTLADIFLVGLEAIGILLEIVIVVFLVAVIIKIIKEINQ